VVLAKFERLMSDNLNPLAGHVVTFCGKKHYPDLGKAFVNFQVASAFPNCLQTGLAIHPRVLARSWHSLKHQPVSWEHRMSGRHVNGIEIEHDELIGAVTDCILYSITPGDIKVITAERSSSIIGLAVLGPTAHREEILESPFGRFSASMEIVHDLSEDGFAISMASKPTFEDTPSDMLSAGWEYCSWDAAPDSLRDCYSEKQDRIVSKWQGREVRLLLGGLCNEIHFAGVAVVRHPAEKTSWLRVADHSTDFAKTCAKAEHMVEHEAPIPFATRFVC
jgi:hypothetical protein